MSMLTYITRDGRELSLQSETECASAIRNGDLHTNSIVMDAVSGRWMRASEHPALSGLCARIQPKPAGEAPARRFKAAAIAVWLIAIAGPALIAVAHGVDVAYVLVRSLLCTALLCAAGIVALVFIRSERGRWRLSIVLAALTFAAGAAGLAGAWH